MISNSYDIIDSRDIVDRFGELTDLIEAGCDDDEASDELGVLIGLIEAIDNYSDDNATDGVQLIRDSCFEQYARELAEEIGAIDSDAKWPVRCIDWKQAAEELQTDYTAIDFDGVTYWIR